MRDLVIIGNGVYAQMMYDYIQLTKFGNVIYFAVEETYRNEDFVKGIEVISIKKFKETVNIEDVQLIMGIGYTKMSDVRKRIYEELTLLGYEFINFIHPSATISPDAVIGKGNNILEGVIVEMGVTIGNANLFFAGSIVGHESYIGNYNTFSINAVTAGCVTVKNNCFLGVSSATKDHITLDDYVLLGATAYAYKDIPEYSIVVPGKSQIIKDKKSTDYL